MPPSHRENRKRWALALKCGFPEEAIDRPQRDGSVKKNPLPALRTGLLSNVPHGTMQIGSRPNLESFRGDPQVNNQLNKTNYSI
jgi:hypothetical protein